MDAEGEKIIRAYPLPSFPARHLIVDDDTVYCSRQGDGGLLDSMLCRIDRDTLEWKARIFPWKDEYDTPGLIPDFYVPDNWTINDPIDQAFFDQMNLTEIGLVVEGWGGARLVDVETLQLQEVP